jgi:hypothetical protein
MGCLANAARAAEEIKVPFNFRWGDPPKLVEDTILRANAKVVERKTVSGRNTIVVEGHPDPRLQRSVFYFTNDALTEVELQYGDPNWDTAKISAIFEQTRRNLDRKYGTSRNVARQKTKEEGVVQTIVGYKWTQSYSSLSLFLYIADKGADSYRILSYHYRGF